MAYNQEKYNLVEIKNKPKQYGYDVDIKLLSVLLNEANKRYHTSGYTILDDRTYDILYDILKERDPNDELFSKVGADIEDDEKKKVKLPYWMGSMDKIKDGDSKLDRWLKKYKGPYVIGDKEDGISCLYYINNNEIKLFTRGNGKEGKDISFIKDYINLPAMNTDKTYAIRGELIVSKENFKKYDKKLNESQSYSTARNMVSGIIGSKTISNNEKKILKDIDFVSYEMLEPRIKISEQYSELNKLGFNVVPNSVTDELNFEYLKLKLNERKTNSNYEIDGIIITNDDIHKVNKSKNPDYSFAFKMDTDEQKANTTIEEIKWSPNRYGELIPVVIIKQVIIQGAKINKALAHNARFVKENGIGPGANIIIIRSGDVIPKIFEVTKKVEPKMPDIKFEWDNNDVHILVKDLENLNDSNQSNMKNIYDEIEIKQINNFFSKIKVTDCSKSTIELFYKNGINSINKILSSSIEDFEKLPTFKIKKATKVYNSIQSSISKASLSQIMAGIGVFNKGMGEKRIQLILDKYPDILTRNFDKDETINDISNIDGFNTITAETFTEGLLKSNEFLEKNEIIKEYILKAQEKHENSLIQNLDNDINNDNMVLKNKYYVFTKVRDEEIEKLIKDNGGVVTENYTKKTTILVVPNLDTESGKVSKAKKNNTKIMDIENFKKYIKFEIESLKKKKNIKNDNNSKQDKKQDEDDNDEPKQDDNDEPKQDDNDKPKQDDNNESKQDDNNESKQDDNNESKQDDNNESKQDDNNESKQHYNNESKQNENDESKQLDKPFIRNCPPSKPYPPCKEGFIEKEKTYKNGDISICCYKDTKSKSKNDIINKSNYLNSINSLKGLSVAFTGFKDPYLEKVIISNGGKICNEITKDTTVLITNKLENRTVKVNEALRFEIPIVRLETFNKKIKELMLEHKTKRITLKKKIKGGSIINKKYTMSIHCN